MKTTPSSASPTLALLLIAVALGGCAPASTTGALAGTGPAVEREGAAADSIHAYLAAAVPADVPGAAVIVVKDGRTLLRGGYGLADLELGVPVSAEHIFRIGSVTKQFTAAGILLLAQEGRLSLDDDMRRFLPDYPTGGRLVTIEHLLNHTSGIRSYTGMPGWRELHRRDLSLDELIALFRDEPFDFEPGERWEYNNSAYVLLGAIIERASGQPYDSFMRARLFEPLGLASTSIDSTHAVIRTGCRGTGRGRAAAGPTPTI